MIVLALDAALARCSTAVLVDGAVAAADAVAGGRGHGAALAPLAAAVLARAGVAADRIDGVAVTVGPGSFTGLRAALALAHGIALGAGCPVVGVTVAEALAASLALPRARVLWVAIDNRRGRVFLDRGAGPQAMALTDLPMPAGAVAVAGDAALAAAAQLAARGADVMLTDARLPEAAAVARVGMLRLAGGVAPLAAVPLYVDPPEARLPAGGLRPAPLPA